MFNWFKKKKVEEPAPKPRAKKKTAKELATERGEPWVNVLDMEIDMEDINSGAFTLDWNDKFVAQLMRFGYTGKTDQDIVDQWFQNVCRNIALEMYEQEQADLTNPNRFHNVRNIGDGRKEIK